MEPKHHLANEWMNEWMNERMAQKLSSKAEEKDPHRYPFRAMTSLWNCIFFCLFSSLFILEGGGWWKGWIFFVAMKLRLKDVRSLGCVWGMISVGQGDWLGTWRIHPRYSGACGDRLTNAWNKWGRGGDPNQWFSQVMLTLSWTFSRGWNNRRKSKNGPPLPTMFYFLMNTNNYVVVSNIFYFHPLEKMIQFDWYFSDGWFNHHLVLVAPFHRHKLFTWDAWKSSADATPTKHSSSRPVMEKARSTRNSPGSSGGFGKRGNFCLPPKRCRWFPISEIWKDTADTDTYIEDKFQIWMIRLRLPGISPKPLKSTHVWWSFFPRCPKPANFENISSCGSPWTCKFSSASQFCDCDLFGMKKTWPELKGCWWPPMLGDKKGHFESPGNCCLLCKKGWMKCSTFAPKKKVSWCRF